MGAEYPIPDTGDGTVDQIAQRAWNRTENAGEQRPAPAHQFHGAESGVGAKQRASIEDQHNGARIGRNSMAGQQAPSGFRLLGSKEEIMAPFKAQNRTDGPVAKSTFAIVEKHGGLFFVH